MTKLKFKFVFVSTLCVLLFILLLSNAVFIRAQQPLYGGTLVFGGANEPPTLNPILNWETASVSISGKVYETLVDNDMGLRPIPSLAESWEVSEDMLSYTFHLERNVTWHDGKPFTSADVKFSIWNLSRQYAPWKIVWATYLESIETPDDYTAIFKLNKPIDIFRYLFVIGWILPKHLYEGADFFKTEYNWEPIGTGPFIFENWVKGSFISFKKNPNYWKEGLPYLDKVIFRPFTDPSVLVLAFEKREIYHSPQQAFPLSEFERFQKMPGVTIVAENTGHSAIDFVFFNMRKLPWTDVRVRRAIVHAINFSAMKDMALYGVSDVDQPSIIARIPMMMEWFNPNVVRYEYNPEKAKQLLDEAGYPADAVTGIRFDAVYVTWGLEESVFKEAELIRYFLGEIGVEVKITRAPIGVWIDITAKSPYPRDFDMAHLGYSTGPNPLLILPQKYMSAWANSTDPYTNIAGYSNATIDVLWEEGLNNPGNITLANEIQYLMSLDLPGFGIASRDKVDIHYSDEFANIHGAPWSAISYDDVWWRFGHPAPTPTPIVEVKLEIPDWFYIPIFAAAAISVACLVTLVALVGLGYRKVRRTTA